MIFMMLYNDIMVFYEEEIVTLCVEAIWSVFFWTSLVINLNDGLRTCWDLIVDELFSVMCLLWIVTDNVILYRKEICFEIKK
jgi:hypothetical protein